ncbi:MAG: DNA replication/repair protein RecF [Lachnospiraceae bacterium]|nr:DNA replication/repair protein RecF [Lachnospiraceae bacterium]
MIIKKLELMDFRNYMDLDLELSEGVNIFFGDNAQGKTNILEAIYLCCTTRSQKRSHDKDMIRFGEDEAHLKMFFYKQGLDRKLDMHLIRGKKKTIAIDGVPATKNTEIYGMMNIISFSPDDLSIIKDGPAERRNFIDMELCQLDREYMFSLSSYNRALLQRNNLLKQIFANESLKGTLDIWDKQVADYGKVIIEKRDEFIRRLNDIAAPIHKNLTDGEEELNIRYIPNTAADSIHLNIAASRDRDILSKMSNVGPHRDDMECIINGDNARVFGSQGQQRTVALTLKLAEIELVKKSVRDDPVLLLDDVLSELDRNRQTQLLSSISGIQTIITCTGLEEFIRERIKCDKVFKVDDGHIKELDNY